MNKRNKLNFYIPFLAHFSAFVLVAFLTTPFVWSQTGRLVRETLHSRLLEKTVTGESADRNAAVYLPPSYDKKISERYPVIYLLHGIGDNEEEWTSNWSGNKEGYGTIPELMDKGISEGRFGEMIVVMPDERTKAFGSFYVNSSVTGNWEDFTARELVDFIDKKYRTIPEARSRGIAGHSMGGYGAITLGMKHPDVFSVVYGLNPAALGWSKDLTIDNPAFRNVLTGKSLDELLQKGIYSVAVVTVAQAFSPNPNRPPFFADFPFADAGGKLQPAEPAFSLWQENFPVNMVKKYRANLAKLRGLRFDSGYEDEYLFIPPNCRALSAELTGNGIEHIFEEYNGDHRNRLHGRTGRIYTQVLPYFWFLLESQSRQR